MTSSTLIACLKARLQRQSHSEVLGVRAPIEERWGRKPVRSTVVTVSQHHSVTMSRCHSCPGPPPVISWTEAPRPRASVFSFAVCPAPGLSDSAAAKHTWSVKLKFKLIKHLKS